MSKEYIDRDMAEQALIKEAALILRKMPYIAIADSVDRMIKIVQEVPAADVTPVVHGELTENIHELLRAEKDGRLVVMPCRVGDRVYRVIDDCTFPGDCGTTRLCKGCEYRNLFIEATTFRLYLLTDDGKLRRGYYRTREEAEKALKGNKDYPEIP